MDHVNGWTAQFEMLDDLLWIDYEATTYDGNEQRSVDMSISGECFTLTSDNIYDIIDELKKAAAWLEGDE